MLQQVLNYQGEMVTLTPARPWLCSIMLPGQVHQALEEGPLVKMQILTQEYWGSWRVGISSKLQSDVLSAIAQTTI